MAESTSVAFQRIKAAVGTTIGPSAWIAVTQDGVDSFANAISSHEAAHVNREGAANSLGGATIAQGFYVAAFLPKLIRQLFRPAGVKPGIVYGVDKLRFPAPVRTGRRIRLLGRLDAAELASGGLIARFDVTVEIEEESKPACAGTILMRYTEEPGNG